MACLLVALAAVPTAHAQSPGNELSQYTNAVARVDPMDRVVQLERFAVNARPGLLKSDALEFVIWEYLRQGKVGHALVWADALADTDKDNPVAMALLSNGARVGLERGTTKSERLLAMASHGLDALPQLSRPPGMSEADFVELERRANAMLSDAAGAAELRLKDYVAARIYLHNAGAEQSNSARDVYAMALADLDGPDRDRREGYWCLARAVDLSRGTAEGREIARYARARYVKDGGSTTDWNQFLATAAAPTATGTRKASLYVPHPVPPPPARSAQPAASTRVARQPATVAKVQPTITPVTGASALPLKPPAPARKPAPSVWADTETSPAIVRKRSPVTVGPVSLGILVETSLAGRRNRSVVVDSLIDMLRHMSNQDEAFVLTYDNNLVFAEDLTNDPQQLAQALESIKPQRGAVLDDAIAFAAGHLARIARYPNRVLLVISDGRNVDSHTSPLQTSAEINAAGVRIYCIGIDVSQGYGRYRLQLLSSSTGGQSRFISDPGQFRKATEMMAQNMGIDFRF